MADHLSRGLAAPADPTRRDLIARRTAGASTLGDLAEPHQISLQAADGVDR